MARASNEIEFAWRSLNSEGDGIGWQTIAITPAPTCKISAGRHFPEKMEALMVEFPGVVLPRSEKLPDGAGFNVVRVDGFSEECTWLALTRKANGDPDLFLAMVCDIAGSLDEETGLSCVHPIRRFLGRVRGWQEFMRSGARALSTEAEIGLVGELTFLEALLASGIAGSTCLESWVGPFDAPQDFVLGSGAVEVKSTLSTLGFPAKIGSLEQLDDALLQPLFIAGVRLSLVDNARALPEIVGQIRTQFENESELTRQFAERLLAVGYFDQHADRYQRHFALLEIKIIPVAAHFPRLTSGSVPLGITRAAYDIDLDKILLIPIDMQAALIQLGVL